MTNPCPLGMRSPNCAKLRCRCENGEIFRADDVVLKAHRGKGKRHTMAKGTSPYSSNFEAPDKVIAPVTILDEGPEMSPDEQRILMLLVETGEDKVIIQQLMEGKHVIS